MRACVRVRVAGAFGFVRLARNRETGVVNVVKFIRKDKVLSECWETGEAAASIALPPLAGGRC